MSKDLTTILDEFDLEANHVDEVVFKRIREDADGNPVELAIRITKSETDDTGNSGKETDG